jgi:hypothetical protein
MHDPNRRKCTIRKGSWANKPKIRSGEEHVFPSCLPSSYFHSAHSPLVLPFIAHLVATTLSLYVRYWFVTDVHRREVCNVSNRLGMADDQSKHTPLVFIFSFTWPQYQLQTIIWSYIYGHDWSNKDNCIYIQLPLYKNKTNALLMQQ